MTELGFCLQSHRLRPSESSCPIGWYKHLETETAVQTVFWESNQKTKKATRCKTRWYIKHLKKVLIRSYLDNVSCSSTIWNIGWNDSVCHNQKPFVRSLEHLLPSRGWRNQVSIRLRLWQLHQRLEQISMENQPWIVHCKPFSGSWKFLSKSCSAWSIPNSPRFFITFGIKMVMWHIAKFWSAPFYGLENHHRQQTLQESSSVILAVIRVRFVKYMSAGK